MSNCKHPLGSRPGGSRLQGSIQAGAYAGGQGCTGGVPTHLPPLLSSQGSELGPESIKDGFTSDAGVGDLAQVGLPVQQEGLQPDTRKNFLDWEKRQRNSPLHPPRWIDPDCPLPFLPFSPWLAPSKASTSLSVKSAESLGKGPVFFQHLLY